MSAKNLISNYYSLPKIALYPNREILEDKPKANLALYIYKAKGIDSKATNKVSYKHSSCYSQTC